MPESSADYLARCDALEAQGRAAIEAGDTSRGLALLDQAAQALGTAIALGKLEKLRERLQARDQADTLSHMDMSHSLATSVGKGRGDAAFTEARRAKGLTMADVAAKAKMGVSALKMARSGKRTIPRDKAEKIAHILDWPATAQNWPGGIS